MKYSLIIIILILGVSLLTVMIISGFYFYPKIKKSIKNKKRQEDNIYPLW